MVRIATPIAVAKSTVAMMVGKNCGPGSESPMTSMVAVPMATKRPVTKRKMATTSSAHSRRGRLTVAPIAFWVRVLTV
jgi:hypothetical protein